MFYFDFISRFYIQDLYFCYSTGFGSVGSIVEGPFIARILNYSGWGGTFYAMVVLTVMAALAVLKACMTVRNTTTVTVTTT